MNDSTQDLMAEIASDETLEEAYAWLCKRRKEYSPNNDVWNVRWRWAEIKPQLQAALLAGRYRFRPVDRYRTQDGAIEVWSSLDALVLKAMAIVLTRHLAPQLSQHCYHLVGRGGAKAAVRAVAERLADYPFVFRTDVKGYYASIDHDVLLEMAKRFIADDRVLGLLQGYMQRTVYDDGFYHDIRQGISLGCALSPLMGALYLTALDERMAQAGLFYARFMDDWVILAPTRWKLRRAVRIVNQTLNELKVEKHPDKTFIGRVGRGFDFLGYRFSPAGLTVAPQARQRFVERTTRLYEQGANNHRIELYARHWQRWATTGVPLAG